MNVWVGAGLALLVASLPLGGCIMVDPEKLVTALADDQASACVSSHVVYGIGNGRIAYCRANADGTDVVVNPDGAMSLKRALPRELRQEPDRVAITAQTIDAMAALLTQLQAAVKALAPPAPLPAEKARPKVTTP